MNETDLYCLHYVFKQRINSTLASFVESWNNHCLQNTPYQLFIRGAIANDMFPQQPRTVHVPTVNALSITPRGHVQIPRINFQPCVLLRAQLAIIDPQGPSNDFGCDIYLRVVNIIGQHLQHNCNDCE